MEYYGILWNDLKHLKPQQHNFGVIMNVLCLGASGGPSLA